MKLNNILILGSLPKDKEREELYNTIIGVCKKYSNIVKSPIDTAKFIGTDKERYKRAFETVKEADFIIGEQSEPSTGQGMELREAHHLNKPVLVVAEKGSKVSGLVKGCPVVSEIIYYDDVEDLKNKLEHFMEIFKISNNNILELKGANMDIDLFPNDKVSWEIEECPWNKNEGKNIHKCAIKNVSICKHFQGIKKVDIVLCSYNIK